MPDNDASMGISFEAWMRRPSLFSACAMYFFACMGQVTLTLVTYLMVQAFPNLSMPIGQMTSLIFHVGFLLIPSYMYCRSRFGMSDAIRIRLCPAPALFLCALAAVSGVFLADALGSLWLMALELLGASGIYTSVVPLSAAAAALKLLTATFIPAVCEEIMFRGILLSAFERFGTKRAVLFSALMFASLHGSFAGLPVHLLMGLVLGMICVYADSLYAGIVYHFIYNALILLLGGGQSVSGSKIGQILEPPAAGSLTLRVFVYGAVLSGLVYAVNVLCAPGRRNTSPKPRTLDTQTLIVLSGGVVTMILVYLVDILSLWGALS